MEIDYWLRNWLQQLEISDEIALHRALRDDVTVDLALEVAETHAQGPTEIDPLPGSVVAGRRLDLSGVLSCGGRACLEREVDQLFASVGYYFDHVIVEGLSPRRFLRPYVADDSSRALLRADLRTHAEILLLLDRVGALNYVTFVEKPYSECGDHYHDHARDLGIPALADDHLENEMLRFLEKEATMRREVHGDLVAHLLIVPGTKDRPVLWRSRNDPEPSLEEVARGWVAWHSLGLLGDVALAKKLDIPLTAAADRFVDLSEAAVRPLTPEDVALSIQLPVLNGLPAEDVIRLREDDRDHFIRFRQALTAAIRDQIGKTPDSNPRQVADKVVREFVEPEVAAIGARLEAATTAFRRKSANNFGIATVMTTVGLLGGLPLLIAGGAAALGGLLVHANQLTEERKDVELADMYFLWNVEKEHGSHN